MSYSRRINESIHVHYSKTVHWGKTETGGSETVVFDDYIPVNINLHVDTSPFDSSVNRCKSSVDVLTGAVVAANSAEVASIRSGADKVADHVIGGFFNMIKSELSQNMAALYSKFNAIRDLMADRHKTLSEVQTRMDSDYTRTVQKYYKIFLTLDEELKRRVVVLDKNAYEFGQNVKSQMLTKEAGEKIVNAITKMHDDEIVNQQLSVAKNHSRVKNLINDLGDHVLQEEIYSRKMNNVIREFASDQIRQECIPVVFLEKDSISNDGLKDSICYASDVPGAASEKVKNSVSNFFASNPSGWRELNSIEKTSLDTAFNAIAEKSLGDSLSSGDDRAKRIYETIMQLKNQSDTQTF